MEMEDQVQQQQQFVGMADLRQLMNGRPAVPSHAELFSGHPAAGRLTQYEMMMVGVPRGELQDLMDTKTTAPCGGSGGGLLEMSDGGCFGGGDGGSGRWPRQETLLLLEIRSRLDSKFKEANQKGPLWDEVSRIMSEEHGYQRSGKKCREKFENLYKYYKKTKEGKAGRQDGKHYRFFRQLEALYGDTSNTQTLTQDASFNTMRFHTTSNTSIPAINQDASILFHSQKLCDSLSISNSPDFDTSSSDDNDPSTGANDSPDKRKKRRGGMRSWKVKIKDFIDSQMRKLVEKQEDWLERLTRTLEQKEQDRMIREEEWRKQEASRIDRENKFWAKERAWMEARDSALMETLRKITGVEVKVSSPGHGHSHGHDQNGNNEAMLNKGGDCDTWQEYEITRLIELRSVMEPRFQQSSVEDHVVLWEEISAKMAHSGYERSALVCKDKWDSINDYIMTKRNKEGNNKRRKEGSSYFPNNESLYNQGGGYGEMSTQDGSSPSNPSTSNVVNVNDSCFRFLMSDGANSNLWDNYGLKLSRGGNQ